MPLSEADKKVLGRRKAAQKAAQSGKVRPQSVLQQLTHPEFDVNLNEKQGKYVEARAAGLSERQAAIKAGAPPRVAGQFGHRWENQGKVRKALTGQRAINALFLGLTREDVLTGLMDAVEHAQLLSDPGNEIAGWREIAKICGFYAPEVKKIHLSDGAKTYLSQMESMSDEDLLKLAMEDVIDVDFVEKPEEGEAP
jgi:hypothetical protein